MGTQEERFVDYFYDKYKGRVAIGVGYAAGMVEVFPFVLENSDGKVLGSIAMATLSDAHIHSVHIFHLNAFRERRGRGSTLLRILCLKADQMNVTLSLSPVPAANGEPNQITSHQLTAWYRKFGFGGDGLLCRLPQTV